MSTVEIVRVPVLSDNYVWLMHDPASAETVAVDPSVAEPVLAAAAERGWTIGQIWNTHWHPDHTGGNADIKAATGCTISGPAAEAGRSASAMARVEPFTVNARGEPRPPLRVSLGHAVEDPFGSRVDADHRPAGLVFRTR